MSAAGPPVIYLDHLATTPLDPRVAAAMRPFLDGTTGNPHARHHAPGRAAAQVVDQARRQVAAAIGARPGEILFTSGATEANNLAIQGTARHFGAGHVVTVATEHASVLEPCRALAAEGFRLTVLPVDGEGRVDPRAVAEALRPDTILVSVMVANNETGTLQPIEEIATLCRRQGVRLHCDAAQALGRVPLDMAVLPVDLLTLSAHKAHGPPGIGALYLRQNPPVQLAPLGRGGGQERGLRPGTLPAMLCAGFGAAAALAGDVATEASRLRGLRDRLERSLRAALPVQVNGSVRHRLAGSLSVTLPGIDAAELIERLPGLALGTGAACAAERGEPSHVLRAMGLDDRLCQATLRLSVGRFTTVDEVDAAAAAIVAAASA